jgi:hypothetical protein
MMPTTAIEETPLTAEELDRGKRYLEQTKNQIVGALRHVVGAQWNYQPGPERWSIAQIAEHIIHVQELVLGPMREKLRQTPSTAPHPDYKLVDDIVIYQFPNRLNKFPSPIQSPGGLTKDEALQRLTRNYGLLHEYLENTPDLRQHATEANPLKAISGGAYQTMDGYQWILAEAAHTERHTKQILEVMADPAYPAS